MGFIFLYRPKPKKFTYKPVFYKAEEDEVSIGKRHKILTTKENKEVNLKTRIQKSWSKERQHTTVSKENMIRTLIILVLLIIVIFFVKIG